VRRRYRWQLHACLDLASALRCIGERMDASWGLDFSVVKKLEKHYARDNQVHSCKLRETGREKQAIRVNIINQSNLGIKVLVWEEAESLAQQIVPKILEIVSSGKYVFYIGAIIYELGSANYVKEALACVLDSQRNPVLFPKDADACSIDQVLEDFEFQVINLTQRSQYCEIRMLETCIQCALHEMPGRLWLNLGSGTYLSKVEDVKRQIQRASTSSLFLTFAPRQRLIEHKVRVRENMPALRAFLQS
jgi:hypothetical protein